MIKPKLSALICFVFMFVCNDAFSQADIQYQSYKVVKGDNYYKLSKKFNCSVEEIQKANDNKTVLKLGETIRIPIKSVARVDLYKQEFKEHTVIKGETLHKIAAQYGTNVGNLKKLNNLSGDQLRVGQKIKVPSTPKPVETHTDEVIPVKAEPPAMTAKSRDTIAKKIIPPGPRGGTDVNPGMPEKTVSTMNDLVSEKEEVAVAKVVSQKMEDTRSHVMHPTLPKGNIIVVYNPQSGRMAYCKVVDNYTPRQYDGSGLIMTPAVADKIGLNSNVASVKIKYAAP